MGDKKKERKKKKKAEIINILICESTNPRRMPRGEGKTLNAKQRSRWIRQCFFPSKTNWTQIGGGHRTLKCCRCSS